jgi:hypothetical protein
MGMSRSMIELGIYSKQNKRTIRPITR